MARRQRHHYPAPVEGAIPTFRYDSIEAYKADVADLSKGTKRNREFWKEYAGNVNGYVHRGNEWFGPFGTNIAEATKALQGWQDGMRDVIKLGESLDVPPPVSTVRRIRKSDQGDELDLQDVYAGRLDTAWRVAKRDHRATRSREIWLSNCMGINFLTTGKVLYWRGAAVLALADMLTLAGYSVGILANVQQDRWNERGDTVRLEVVIKDPLAPLDLGALTGALVNPGFYRVLYWKWCSTRDTDLNDGLGRPHDYPIEDMIQGTAEVNDHDTAKAYVSKVIASLNADQ